MNENVYKRLAKKLDSLPNGYPETEDGVELKLLEKLFSPQEARLAAELRITPETAEEIYARLGEAWKEPLGAKEVFGMLKSMAKRGLINVKKTEKGLGFSIRPFVVGIYEAQVGTLDVELARLFEEYYRRSFGRALEVKPAFHRVIPVQESLATGIEVQPYESVTEIVNHAQAWGVMDCICRKQKALIGEACDHPLEMCMVFHHKPGVFENHPVIRALTLEEAHDTLKEAANAGLVHSVSNSKEGVTYICNCCTCSCGILRGMSELGIANVVARSAYVNQVDESLCTGCQDCISYCQFDALEMSSGFVQVIEARCVGCGVCVTHCLEGALHLVMRPEEEILPVPENEIAWMSERAKARNLQIQDLL